MLELEECFKEIMFMDTGITIPKKWINELGWKYGDLLEFRIVKSTKLLKGETVEDYIENTGCIPDFSDYIMIKKLGESEEARDNSIVKKLGKGNRITISKDMQRKCNIGYEDFIELMVDPDEGSKFISIQRSEEIAPKYPSYDDYMGV